MFALFLSLYHSMFTGTWSQFDLQEINGQMISKLNSISKLVTSVFGDNQYATLGAEMSGTDILFVVSFILALITSIGIVVMAVKGIKRVFGVFFMGINRL